MSIRNKLYLLSETDQKDKLLSMPLGTLATSTSIQPLGSTNSKGLANSNSSNIVKNNNNSNKNGTPTTHLSKSTPTIKNNSNNLSTASISVSTSTSNGGSDSGSDSGGRSGSNSSSNSNNSSNMKKADMLNKRRLSSSSNFANATATNSPLSKKAKPTRCITHSERMVKATKSKYRPFFTQTQENADDSPRSSPLKDDYVLTLEYPGVGEYENFLLLKPVKMNARQDDVEEDNDEYHPVNDIYQTAFWIYDCYLTREQQALLGDASHGIMRNLTKYRNRRNGPGFANAVNDFNKVIKDLKMAGEIAKNAKRLRHPSYDLTCHILYQVYSRTVAHQADALNNYQAFSNYVYGEINASLVNEFIIKTNITSKSVFMDLGCGIGNVVLQVAAQTGCESYGIEIMETPCKYAKRQLKEYATRMKAWCLPTGKVHFRQGDFLDTAANDMYTTMKRADVLLVNNYAFDAKTNHALAQMFLDLKEGTKIISLKSFVPKHHKINQRTLDMPESILKVEEFEYYSEAVSWTNNSGMYYLATVDRSRLRPFYDALYSN